MTYFRFTDMLIVAEIVGFLIIILCLAERQHSPEKKEEKGQTLKYLKINLI